MIFLPIVNRELRVGSRRRVTYWIRLAGAFLPIAIGTWVGVLMVNEAPQSLGRSLFEALSFFIYLLAFFAGSRLTADCLSEEKREGTLGLLFLTDLKTIDIIMGKLAATSLVAFYALLAVFPVLAVCLLLGGVTYAEFWRVLIVSVNLILFSLSVGMFSSSLCKEDRQSMALTFCLLLLTSVLSPVIGALACQGQYSNYNNTFNWFSPIAGCFLANESLHSAHRVAFVMNAVCTLILSLIFLLLASHFIKTSWQEKTIRAAAPSGSNSKNRDERSAKKLRQRRKALAINPFLWLVTRNRGKEFVAWGVLALTAGLWIWGYLENERHWFNSGTYLTTAILLHTFFKLAVASEASRRFVIDRRSGALELMLTTPMQVIEIIKGQLLGLVSVFGGPILVILLADLFFLFAGLEDSFGEIARHFWILMVIGGILIFLLDMLALAVLSIWLGMTKTKSNRAAASSFSKIVVLPIVVFTLVYTISSVAYPSAEFWSDRGLLLFWFGLGAITDLSFLYWATSRSLARFRLQATEPFHVQKTRTN